MDPLRAAGTSASAWQLRSIELRAAESAPWAAEMSHAEETSPAADLPAVLDAAHDDPAREQGLMANFLSRVDADCFVSLLQTTDPLPSDDLARAEYRRHYRELHDSLVIPVPPKS